MMDVISINLINLQVYIRTSFIQIFLCLNLVTTVFKIFDNILCGEWFICIVISASDRISVS